MKSAYDHAVADLCAARSARERGEIVERLMAMLGVSRPTVYRQLAAAGWDSGRATRQDAGVRELAAADLSDLSALMARGRNKRGQVNVPAMEAYRIAQEQGLAAGETSYATFARRLREEGLSLGHIRAPEASVARVSSHPNHVWFIDYSVAIQWYFRDDRGAKLGQHMDAGARYYEGKVENFRKLRKIIHRYMVTDHYSGCYFVQYYYSSGERAEDVVDFLVRAMSPKPGLEHAYPFRGIPARLVMDKGGANRAGVVQTLLGEQGLGITVEFHERGNAKASGAVEKRHHNWQTSFEGRLAQQPATSLEELNDRALKFCAVAMGEADRKHSRHGHTPLSLWSTIRPEQLREAPPRAVFLQLAMSTPREGVLDGYLRLRADGATWQITGGHAHPTQRVRYRIAPWAPEGIRVWDAFNRELTPERLSFNAAGFPLNGLRHEWDNPEAAGATAPSTPGQDVAAAVEADAEREVPEMATLPVFTCLDEQLAAQAYLAPKGVAWDAPELGATESPPVGLTTAKAWVIDQLQRPLSPNDGAWWRARVEAGLTEAELPAALEDFLAVAGPQAEVG